MDELSPAKKMSFYSQSNFDKIPSMQRNNFPINDNFPLAGKNDVDFFILLTRMNEGNTCTCRKIVYADLSIGLLFSAGIVEIKAKAAVRIWQNLLMRSQCLMYSRQSKKKKLFFIFIKAQIQTAL